MSGTSQASVMQRRLATALVVVAALIAAVPVSGALVGESRIADTAGPSSVGIRAQALSQAGDIDGLVSQLEETARADGKASVPAWFQREIGFLPGARDVRADGASVVGYLVDVTCDDALAALNAHMKALGWTAIPLGDIAGATFMKQSGACTWALATCTQVGASTSIVFRCNVA